MSNTLLVIVIVLEFLIILGEMISFIDRNENDEEG